MSVGETDWEGRRLCPGTKALNMDKAKRGQNSHGRRQGRHCQPSRGSHPHAFSVLLNTGPSPTSSPSLVNSWNSPPGEGNFGWDSGTKVLAGKRKLLFQRLTVDSPPPCLGCLLAANCWEGQRIAVEEMLDVRQSCILEKPMVFPHPSFYLLFQTMYAYFFPHSPCLISGPSVFYLRSSEPILSLYSTGTFQEQGRLCLLSVQHLDRWRCPTIVAAIFLLCSGLKFT